MTDDQQPLSLHAWYKAEFVRVRNSYNRSAKATFFMKHLARPAADVVTPFFTRYRIEANHVTYFRLGMVVGALSLIVSGYTWALPISFVCFYINVVLDCVDGNLARLDNTASYWGKFIDGVSDNIQLHFMSLAIALWMWQNGLPEWGLAVAGGISTLSAFAHGLRARFSFFREWMVAVSGPLSEADTARTERARTLQRMAIHVFQPASFFAPVFWLDPTGSWLFGYLGFLVLFQTIPETIMAAGILMEGSSLLRRHRVSRLVIKSEQ